jgi:hypothetical protein
MNSLLDHLGKDTLPEALLQEFVNWCVWEQASPALVIVLENVQLQELAQSIRETRSLVELESLSAHAVSRIQELRKRTGPLGLSAAEAAAFEINNLAKAAAESHQDAESIAFFAARVCGWAGWAETEFIDPMRKAEAESEARDLQEERLQALWVEFGSR